MIIWVFGGTAVGKKRFIQRAANPETRPAYLGISGNLHPHWVEDGPLNYDIASTGARENMIVRWQWGRDELLTNICRDHRDVTHMIVVLSVGLMTQLSRIAVREGCLKWDAESVHGEQQNVLELVHAIAARFRIPVFYVDASNDDYTLRRKVS